MALILTRPREFKIDDKRFRLPGCKLSGDCPHCGKKFERDFEEHYLSYPEANEAFDLVLWCSECDHEWTIRVRLHDVPREKKRREMILIAEDDKQLQKAYERILDGHEVHICDDAADALALLEGGLRPDLIISDLEMPRMLGTSFCNAVRAMGLATPFLLVSGSGGLEKLARDCGADGFGEKAGDALLKIREFAGRYCKSQ